MNAFERTWRRRAWLRRVDQTRHVLIAQRSNAAAKLLTVSLVPIGKQGLVVRFAIEFL